MLLLAFLTFEDKCNINVFHRYFEIIHIKNENKLIC